MGLRVEGYPTLVLEAETHGSPHVREPFFRLDFEFVWFEAGVIWFILNWYGLV